MEEVRGSALTWEDELASLVEDTGMRYSYAAGEPMGISSVTTTTATASYRAREYYEEELRETESWKEQVTGFMRSWGEMLLDLGKGCKDILLQTIVTEDSFIVQKVGKPMAEFSGRLKYLNEFLPEDRDPAHAWSVILCVFFLALAVLCINTTQDSVAPAVKRVRIHPPSANRLPLPDGRYMAYNEFGVSADRARFSVIMPHSFLSSRLAGIPGAKASLLEEFGVRLISYDLPGFGESDPHPIRNLNSSAQDMLHLASATGITDKFWVLGHSSGCIHVWAALRYIPSKIAGAALFAPLINPYEPSMSKEESRRTWENWLPRRKFMYLLAQKFPNFLSYFYQRSFLSGNHGRIDKWMSLSLGRKDEILIEDPRFEEFWQRDVEESIRQGSTKPFIEEAVLQVSNWGFSVSDLQVKKKCQRKGYLLWLSSLYSQQECELTGFLGPIHIWQGMDDKVVPPSMTDYISRVLPGVVLHKLQNEGHFSYFFMCHECHRQIFLMLFGDALGPLAEEVPEVDAIPSEKGMGEASSDTSFNTE